MFRLLRISRLLPTRLVACATAVGLLAAGGGFAVAATGMSIPRLGLNVSESPGKAAAVQRLASVATTDSSTEAAGAPLLVRRPIPARLLGPEAPVPIAPSLLRVRNAWLVSDGRTLVAVYAGEAGNDRSLGRLVIVRQDLVAGRQAISTIDARATGALTITGAPLGASVERSAQKGDIRLRTARGAALRLDLGTGRLGRR